MPQKPELISERVNSFTNKPLILTCLQNKSFENTVEKGEIAHYEQFLLFPTVFFYPLGELSVISIQFEIGVCKLF